MYPHIGTLHGTVYERRSHYAWRSMRGATKDLMAATGG